MRARIVLALLVLLAPARARAECDAEAVRSAIDAADGRIARMLRAHAEPEQPERWRTSAVTTGEPLIAPVLPGGCSGAIVEYAWTATDRRVPAFRRWRHGVAVLAVQDGHVRVVARRAIFGEDSEPQHHGPVFEPGPEPVIAIRMGGGGEGGGWGGEARFRLRGHRLVAIDTLQVGHVAR